MRLPTSCSEGEKVWCRVIQTASKITIPSGCRSDFSPGLDADSIRLRNERDVKRRLNPNDPDLPDLNQRIAASIAANSKKRWVKAVGKADRKSNPMRWWSLLKGLAGSRTRQAPNQPVSFGGNVFTKKLHIANQFCNQFANTVPFKPHKEFRKIYCDIKIENPLDRSYSPFTPVLTAEAIRLTNNLTAAGPNHITALHLKHLGRRGLIFLTHLFNLSVRDACMPVIWRSANIVPVLKPGKPVNIGTSYCPISLLCPEIKVLEHLLLPALLSLLSPNCH